jgi:hypothetical protein
MAERMASDHLFYVSDECPFNPYVGFAFWSFMAVLVAAVGAFLTTTIWFTDRGPRTSEIYQTTCDVLEGILAKKDLDERNEAFLDACVKHSKKRGHFDGEFIRRQGLGKLEEVYKHFLKTESKRLEDGGKDEEASIEVLSEEHVVEEKGENMV